MAKSRNEKYATFDENVWGHHTQVIVGHNRVLGFRNLIGHKSLYYYLHQNRIVEYTRTDKGTEHIILNTCGYSTATTRNAMCDALRLFGIKGGVSFAGGKFESWVGTSHITEELEQARSMLLGRNVDSRVHHHDL